MTTTYLRGSALPPALLAYVNGEVNIMPKGTFTREEIRLTIWLHKGYLRRAQRSQPGMQYQYPDYERLMRGEITDFCKREMEKSAFEKFDELLACSLRLRAVFEDEMKRRCSKYTHLSEAKHRHITEEAKRATFRFGTQDPRTLGEMEMFLLGRIHYGMPHGQNYQAGDEN